MDKFPEIPSYRIEKKFGSGRLTDTFLAVDEDTRETVAVKVLRPELIADEKFAKRFLYESRKAAKLEHPNIVEILDVGETPEHYYFITEYFRESLRDRLNREHPGLELEFQVTGNTAEGAHRSQKTETGVLTPQEILHIFRQLFVALDYAHTKEAVHRDIRPENIFFRQDGTPVLADFHISELVRASDVLRKMGVKPYLPHYTSPEQALKKHVDAASDIYCLGVTLYEVLTGAPPYDAAEAVTIENMHVMEPIPRLPEQFSLFQPLIDRMMAKEKEDRAGSGTELILLAEELSNRLPESTPELQVEEQVEEQADEHVDVQFQIESTAEEPMDDLPVQKVQLEGVQMQEIPAVEEPVTGAAERKRPEPWHTGTPKHIKSVDDIVKINTISTEGKLAVDTGESEDMGPDLDLPPVKERTHKFKVVDTPQTTGIEELIEKLREPKVLIAAAAAIVIVVILVIFFLFSGGGDETAQTQKASLTPEEIQERDLRYTRKFELAQREFNAGQYKKAMQQLKAAERLKSSKELETMKTQIEAKLAEGEDDNAFDRASRTGTAAVYEEYLKHFPSGRHTEEARNKIDEFAEIEKTREAQRRRWTASQVKLRAAPQTLAKKDVRAMLNQRGFFEKYYNKTGNFRNHFELQVINTQKVVIDYATGLMWLHGGSRDYMDYSKIQGWIDSLNRAKYAGFSDWRVPTLEEVASLLENKENRYNLFIDTVFSSVQKYIWTCDTFSNNKAWLIDFYGGDANPIEKTVNAFVRPVRSEK